MHDVKLTIRLPEELHAALVRAATEDQRSLNGEIVFLLTGPMRDRIWGIDK